MKLSVALAFSISLSPSIALVFHLEHLSLKPHTATWKASTFYTVADAVSLSSDPRSQISVDCQATSSSQGDYISVVVVNEEAPSNWGCYSNGGFFTNESKIVDRVRFYPDEQGVLQVSEYINIPKKGSYMVIIAYCPPASETNFEPAVLEGIIRMHNPHGYLPADALGYQKVYGYIACLYAVASFIWILLVFFKNPGLVYITQKAIAGGFVLSFCEMNLKYLLVHNANIYGTFSAGMSFLVVILGGLQLASIMVILIFSSLGYEIITPAIVTYQNKISILAFLYFCGHAGTGIIFYLYNHGNVSFIGVVAEIPLALLNVYFIRWIYANINSAVMSNLQGQEEHMMTLLKRVLILVILFAVAWYPLSTYVIYTGHADTFWEHKFIIKCAWDIMYLLLQLSIAYIWAPSHLKTEAAYKRVANVINGDEFGDDELTDIVSVKVR